MRTLLKAIIAFCLTAAIAAAYGYWRVNAQGSMDIYLRDTASTEAHGRVLNARLALFDAAGKLLASGKTDDRFGIVLIAHPQAGYCGPELRQHEHAQCHKVMSAWIMEWARLVRHADLEFGNCRLQRIPLEFTAYRSGMLTWWVPLPHVGGDPYTLFSAALTVNGSTCALPGRGERR
jgi:hypothetical protein